MDASSIIKRCGGVTAVAKGCGVAVNSVAYWRHRNSIPAEHWPNLLRLAAEADESLTLDMLMQHLAQRGEGTRRQVAA